MNLLFINHDPEIQSELGDFMCNQHDKCFYSRNTSETIQILDEHSIDLAVMIVNHIRDAAVLKYISDNRKDLEVLLVASKEYDEIITLFCESQYKTFRLPQQFRSLLDNLDGMIAERSVSPCRTAGKPTRRNEFMH